MATYSQIQEFVKSKYNINVKVSWIVDVKEMNGLSVEKNIYRDSSCPDNKIIIIEKALKYFEIL